MTIASVRYGGPKLQASTATHASSGAGPFRELLALVGVQLDASGAVIVQSAVSNRACYTALARLGELESDEARRAACHYIGEAAGVLCLASGALWTPLLDAVSDAHTLCFGNGAARFDAPAPLMVANALASALRQRDDSRLALRLLRRWRSPAVHRAVLHYGLRRITPALGRAVLALPSITIAELSRVLHERTAEWQRLLEAARRELLQRLELINPASAEAHALVGALAEITVACANAEHPLSRVLGATGWKTQLGVSGVTAGAPSPEAQHRMTADALRQLSRAVPVSDNARTRRPLWDERTLRAIRRVVECSDGRTSPLELHSGDAGLGIHTWLMLALRPPITPTDARHLLQIARPYTLWQPSGYAYEGGMPPVLALLAHESIPDAVVVKVAHTLSAAEWQAAVPALVRRSAVRTEPALRERLARADSALVRAVLALDEPIASLGDLLRALIDRDPEYAMAAIDARPDTTQVLRRKDVLPLLRCQSGSVRQDAATLLHQLQA